MTWPDAYAVPPRRLLDLNAEALRVAPQLQQCSVLGQQPARALNQRQVHENLVVVVGAPQLTVRGSSRLFSEPRMAVKAGQSI